MPPTSTTTCGRSWRDLRGGLPEQVIEIIAQFTGCTLAEADEARRALGDVDGMAHTKLWFFPRATGRGYPRRLVEEVWKVLEAFASFGFSAHAAAFALPTYQSSWLKAHYPAHFLAGVLTHDPGMYPKRLILDDARQLGITVLGLDVNASEKTYVVERCVRRGAAGDAHFVRSSGTPRRGPDGRGYGAGAVGGEGHQRGGGGPWWRPGLPLAHRLLAPRPRVPAGRGAAGARGRVRRRLRHRLTAGVRRRGKVTRRDLLLQVADLDRHVRSTGLRGRGRAAPRPGPLPPAATRPTTRWPATAATRWSARPPGEAQGGPPRTPARTARGPDRPREGVWGRPPAQSRATRPRPGHLRAAGPRPRRHPGRGGQRAAGDERLRAGPCRAGDPRPRREPARRGLLLGFPRRDRRDPGGRPAHPAQPLRVLVAGVKVATQTPPIRSGRRVVFLTLDDGTGPATRPSSRTSRGPTPPRCSTPGCSWSGGAAPHRTARHCATGC